MHNTLHERLIRVVGPTEGLRSLTLPGTLAAAVRDDIAAFPALRAHQRHAWHAFLAQLGALALLTSGRTEPPEDEASWRTALRSLTPEYPDDAPWQLVMPPVQPALLQPPLPGEGAAELKNRIATPDGLDILVTARNHDLKREVMAEAHPGDWLFALVTLQTMEGFLGRENYGISRMNGGFANRPALGIAPPGGAGARLRRDIVRLLDLPLRNRIAAANGYPRSSGLALTWLRQWDGETSLRPAELDPYYIEICRRVRLFQDNGRIAARAGGSKVPRIAPTQGGITGDPWAPMAIDKDGKPKVLTPDARGFGYRRMVELMFPPSNLEAPLQEPAASDAAEGLTLVARALVRGKGKTEGYHERRVPISRKVRRLMAERATDAAAQAARDRVGEAGEISGNVLRPALMALFENGPRAPNLRDRDAERKATVFLRRFELLVDRSFFPDLWQELDEDDPARRHARRSAWVKKLFGWTERLLEEADREAAKSTRRRYRARVRARLVLHGCARRSKAVGGYFAGEVHAAA